MAPLQISFSSKLIDYALYDEDTRHLVIFFRNGQRREVDNVPQGFVNRFKRARSAGMFYMTYIRTKFRS